MTTLFEPAIATMQPCILDFCSGAADGHADLCPRCLPLFGPYWEVLLLDTEVREWDPGWTLDKLSHDDAPGAPTSEACLTTS